MKLKFTPRAIKSIKRLDLPVQKRIKKKLQWFLAQENPLVFADFLKDSSLGEYRFRIGNYRAIFRVKGECIQILLVGHRREIYE
jgi:mRNA interferase RelE/StbE